jgi:chromosome segregation ATPase
MTRNEQITEARTRLADLEAKEQERRTRLQRNAAPYAADMEATSRELERLETQARDETARAQLRGIAAGIRLHKTALEGAVFEGDKQLRRVLEGMATHLKAIRENRQKWFEVAETLAPGITKESVPETQESRTAKDAARKLISELRQAGIDLDAALDSSTGRLSPFDKIQGLPTGELGPELWEIFISTKNPEKPEKLARPLKR